jgi:putative transposase
MSGTLHFGKSIHDNGYGMFRVFLKYKLEEQGKHFVKVSKWYPSSKRCSCCYRKKDELALSERVYSCKCGYEADRDVNAAINIRNEGYRIKMGYPDITPGMVIGADKNEYDMEYPIWDMNRGAHGDSSHMLQS